MSVSRRVSMAWGQSPPYEDTDTLVLTGRAYFVDVRVKKGIAPHKLDWAFAGIRTSRDLGDGSTHCAWKHFVDSRCRTPAVDEGIITPDPTDQLRSSERGKMMNPEAGKVEEYKEIWLDEALREKTRVVILERDDGDAFVAMIGNWKLGVGWDWAWRIDAGEVVYAVGGVLEGSDAEVEQDIDVGGKIGNWIVRENWST